MKSSSAVCWLAVMILASAGCSVPEDQQAIAAFSELGGRMKIDDQSHIVEVDLSRTRATDADLMYLRALPYVQTLNCSQTPVTGASLDQAGLQNLQILYLDGSELNDAGLVRIAPLTSLQTLHMGRTKITNAGLGGLKNLSKLRTITAGDTEISDAGLFNFRGLKDLTTLTLRHTKVTPAGVQELRRSLPETQIER